MAGDSQAAVSAGVWTDPIQWTNPFATRFVAPGIIPWVAVDQGAPSLELLAARLTQDFRNRAEIVGPHGSGKSTLMRHLAENLGGVRASFSFDGTLQAENRGGRIVWVQLRAAFQPAGLVE